MRTAVTRDKRFVRNERMSVSGRRVRMACTALVGVVLLVGTAWIAGGFDALCTDSGRSKPATEGRFKTSHL
jgi:hypothetical protein